MIYSQALLFSASVCLFASACNATELPQELFSVGSVKVGATTVEQVTASYGNAPFTRLSPADSTDWALCYHLVRGQKDSFVVFETSGTNPSMKVTGFRLKKSSSPGFKCKSIKDSGDIFQTGNGIHVGQSKEQVRTALNNAPVERNDVWSFEKVTKRAPTSDELSRLKLRWPNEPSYSIDVTDTLTAKFLGDHLDDLYVRRIESY